MANETGEIKAMREALEAICNAWDTFINGLEEDMDGHYPGHYLARRADFENKYLQLAKQALAAPARNCDLYKTKEKAQEAFMGEPCDHPCGNCWVEDINNECGVDWLFTLATEKEGGNDGR